MPCHLISDVHERSNVVPTVSTWYRPNLPPSEQSRVFQREEKSLGGLLQPAVLYRPAVRSVDGSVEARSLGRVKQK